MSWTEKRACSAGPRTPHYGFEVEWTPHNSDRAHGSNKIQPSMPQTAMKHGSQSGCQASFLFLRRHHPRVTNPPGGHTRGAPGPPPPLRIASPRRPVLPESSGSASTTSFLARHTRSAPPPPHRVEGDGAMERTGRGLPEGMEALSRQVSAMREALARSEENTQGMVAALGSFDSRVSAIEASIRPAQVRPPLLHSCLAERERE